MDIKHLLKNYSEKLSVQLFKYLFVAVVAFLVDYGTLFILNSVLGLHHLFAAAMGFVLGLIVNYLLSMLFVFKAKTDNKVVSFLIFLITGLIGLLMTLLLQYMFVDILFIPVLIAKLFTTAIVFFWNFFSRRITLKLF